MVKHPQKKSAPVVESPATAPSAPVQTEAKKAAQPRYVKGRFPVNGIVRLTEAGKANVKRGKSKARFECYRDGMTVAEYVAAVVALPGGSARLAHDDLRWDAAESHGFITVEIPAPVKA
jgi:hypothetical protein